MPNLNELIKQDDWKKEKHVPVIECDDQVKAGEKFCVTVTIGKEVDHPNTTEHHIRWVGLCFLPEGEQIPIQVGHCEFTAHGESTKGANQGPVYTHHSACVCMKTAKPGTLLAMSYCNIHGLWQSSKALAIK